MQILFGRRFGSALRGVALERHRELIQYRRQVRKTYQEYRHGLRDALSKAEQEAMKKAEKRRTRDLKWTEYVTKIRTELQNPHARILRDRHPCRPIVDHTKSEDERVIGKKNLAFALGRQQIARRKYLISLGKEIDRPGTCITKDNLDAKIQHALSNPTNCNHSPLNLISKQNDIKAAIRSIKVHMDRENTTCAPLPSK